MIHASRLRFVPRFFLLWSCALALVAPSAFAIQPTSGAPRSMRVDATDRIIVKLKSAYRTEQTQAMRPERAYALAVTAGIGLRPVRPMSDHAQVLALPRAMRVDAVQAVVDRLRLDPSVEYAYVDAREHLMAIPNDPFFTQQTYLQAPGVSPLVAAVNAPAAWDITKGTSAAAIAIVDGGVRFDHPDLAGRLLSGYDMVSPDCTAPGTGNCTAANQFTTANDGDGRDADASDPGDWVTAAEIASNPFLSGCDVENSTWHGTHIAGIIGAATNNGIGVAGLNWNAAMIPVRVSGKCGAFRSDVIDGMRWAAGLSVPNVPNNARPARIINISLGSPGSCQTSAYKQAVADVLATGAVIVAAAGNEDGGLIQPASCTGVISVGAVRGDGTRTVYSNSGADLTIMAQGGDVTLGTNDRLVSTNNAGTTTPQAYSSSGVYASGAGTSFSTPIVTGVVSLMLSVNPNLTSAQVIDTLKTTARPFVAVSGFATCTPGGSGNLNNTTPCNCTTSACGAGYVDANAAVARASALGGGATTPPPVTPPPGGGAGSSGGGGGGGGAIDPTAILILLAIGLATRRLRPAPNRSHPGSLSEPLRQHARNAIQRPTR